LGGHVEVPTPGGPVNMCVPLHADSGTELRLRGRSVPAHDGVAAGDFYARLKVVLGAPDEALEEFLRNWKPKNTIDPRRDMREQP
jgi:DnaJ-class molecular chaperone